MSQENKWEDVLRTVQNVIYWISIIGPVYSIIKGAIIGVVDEIKKILEEQKGEKS